jgi:hypothetical protein
VEERVKDYVKVESGPSHRIAFIVKPEYDPSSKDRVRRSWRLEAAASKVSDDKNLRRTV